MALLTGSIAAGCGSAGSIPTGTAAETDVAERALSLAEAWTAAWNDLNAERMLRLHAEDLQYYYGGSRIPSRAVFEAILHEDIVPNEDYSLTMLDPHVQVLGPDAAVVSFHLDGEERRAGVTRPFAAAVSLVVARRGGEWKIVHIHECGKKQEQPAQA